MRELRNVAIWTVLLAFCSAAPAVAGTPTIKQKGKVLDTVEIYEQMVPILTTSGVLFTVPEGEQLVVTDVIVYSSGGTATSTQRIMREGSDVLRLSVPENGNAVVNLATGIVFGPGEALAVRNGASDSETTFFVGGYLTKAPKN